LEKNIINNNLIKVNLDLFEKDLINAHKPLDKYFRFLCAKCHTRYDSK